MTAEATNTHYDQEPGIFEAFLDRRMKYTCGIFTSSDTSLDEAQETKLRAVAGLLGLRGGEKVLDVGSGWGSMVCYLAELGCHVTGVTPSARQAAFIRARAVAEGTADRVVIDRSTFDETDLKDQRFAAVTIVGVIEAMPDLVPVLQKIARHLEPGGRVYLSASCFRSVSDFDVYMTRPATTHVAQEIFGWGVLRPLSVLVESFEQAGMDVAACMDLTADYHRTIEHWIDRAERARADIDGIRLGYTDELVRYFTTANAGWGYTTRHYGLVGTLSGHGVAIT